MARISVMWFRSTIANGNGSSEFIEKAEEKEEGSVPLNVAYMCVAYSLLAVSLTSFLFGVISWSLIRKFRNINNYVFLNAGFANVVRLVIVSTTILHRGLKIFNDDLVSVIILSYVTMVYKYCLVVICYMFYIDIVQVFHKDVKRKYMKVALFTWGVPIILTSLAAIFVAITLYVIEDPAAEFILMFIIMIITITCNALPAVVNSIIFIKIIWTLFYKKPDGAVLSRTEICKDKLRRLCLAIVLFVLSNLIVTTLATWEVFEVIFIREFVTSALQIVIVSLFLLLSKSNRALWREYIKKRVLWTLS
ncbi:hypothetical protein HF086_016495 [Spodoptera exigua]|uniref:Uncharacterized protein n=1 Tax=Spodoptera exigua TaxID=7107 RepID=A0A922MUY1_SPOEX|nr:hypothetical protein HF086_016495 [Spodoptera exigua]